MESGPDQSPAQPEGTSASVTREEVRDNLRQQLQELSEEERDELSERTSGEILEGLLSELTGMFTPAPDATAGTKGKERIRVRQREQQAPGEPGPGPVAASGELWSLTVDNGPASFTTGFAFDGLAALTRHLIGVGVPCPDNSVFDRTDYHLIVNRQRTRPTNSDYVSWRLSAPENNSRFSVQASLRRDQLKRWNYDVLRQVVDDGDRCRYFSFGADVVLVSGDLPADLMLLRAAALSEGNTFSAPQGNADLGLIRREYHRGPKRDIFFYGPCSPARLNVDARLVPPVIEQRYKGYRIRLDPTPIDD